MTLVFESDLGDKDRIIIILIRELLHPLQATRTEMDLQTIPLLENILTFRTQNSFFAFLGKSTDCHSSDGILVLEICEIISSQ